MNLTVLSLARGVLKLTCTSCSVFMLERKGNFYNWKSWVMFYGDFLQCLLQAVQWPTAITPLSHLNIPPENTTLYVDITQIYFHIQQRLWTWNITFYLCLLRIPLKAFAGRLRFMAYSNRCGKCIIFPWSKKHMRTLSMPPSPTPKKKKKLMACFSLWFLEEDNINQGKAKSAESLALKHKTSQG